MARTAAPAQTEFASRMRLAREHAQLTQVQVCEALGISQGTLSGLESAGEGTVFLVAFARLYGVSVDWLYAGEGKMLLQRALGVSVSSEAEALARKFDLIKDQNIRRRVFALCLMVMEHGDLPDPGRSPLRVRRAPSAAPAPSPTVSPAARRQRRAG